jgi:hypothetical protein
VIAKVGQAFSLTFRFCQAKSLTYFGAGVIWRDLPGLLNNRWNRGTWSAYHGEQRVAISRSEVDADQECFRRGLNRGEFYVGKLEPDPEGIPPWGTFESDRSLYEFTDPDEPPLDDA